MLCDTCDSKKHKTPVVCAYAREHRAIYLISSRAWPLQAVVLLVFLESLVLLVPLVLLVLLENLPL